MTHPTDIAWDVIDRVMRAGSPKDGCDESWRKKPNGFHRMKAIRHLINAQMIEDGLAPQDNESHDENALTRVAMQLTIKADS
jgi:hypothetical protein